MSSKKDLGWALHAGAGGTVGALFVIGYAKEAWIDGHGWSLTWPHQWAEALAWPAGGLLTIVVGIGIIEAVKWARRGDE